MVKVEEQPRRFLVTLDLSETEAIALATVAASVGGFPAVSDLSDAFDIAGVDWDTSLLHPEAEDEGGDQPPSLVFIEPVPQV